MLSCPDRFPQPWRGETSNVFGMLDTQIPHEFRPYSTPTRVLINWFQAFYWPRSLFNVDSRFAGVGFIWLLGCLPAIVWVLTRAALRRGWDFAPQFLLVVGTVTAVFLVQPLNWWARYTLWIYGAGLPALAIVTTVLGNACPPRQAAARLGRGWAALVVAVLLFESGLTLAHTLYLAPTPYRTWQNLQEVVLGARLCSYLSHELNGTVFDEILAGRREWHFARGPRPARPGNGR